MKAFAKRTTLLAVLVVLAAGWVFLMSLDLSKQGKTTGADGSRASVTYMDEAKFSKLTAYLSVVDGSGQPITGLGQEAFELTEDGIPVATEGFIGAGQQPIVAMLVIDHSGSMDDQGKMDGAHRAAQTFLDQLQAGRDQVGVIVFDDRLDTLYDLNVISDADRQALKSSISRVAPAGSTAYYDAVYSAITALRSQPGRKVVIAMTDGQDNRSRYNLGDTTKFALENKVPIYTIGLGQDVARSLLERMALDTGGRYYFSPDASQLAALYKELAQTLQNEYSLTYTSPTPERDGTRRDVAVTVKHPGATLSAAGTYNPGGVLSVTLNLPLLLGLGALLVGLLFVPGLGRMLKRKPSRAAEAGGDQADTYLRPPTDYLPPSAATPPAYPPPPAYAPSGYPPPPTYNPPPPAYTPPSPTYIPPPISTATSTCVHCGATIRAGAKFCGTCGRQQPVQ